MSYSDGRLGKGLPIRLGTFSSPHSYASGQAQAYILSGHGHGQAQAYIVVLKQIHKASFLGGVEGYIIATKFNQPVEYIFAETVGPQSEIIIRNNSQGFGFAQAQAYILGQHLVFAQSKAAIKATSYGFAQANADIFAKSNHAAQANALIQSRRGILQLLSGTWSEQRGPGYPGFSGPQFQDRDIVFTFIDDETGTWQFQWNSDLSATFSINGTQVSSTSFVTGVVTFNATFTAGLLYNVVIHYNGSGGGSNNLNVKYIRPSGTTFNYLTDEAPPWIPEPLIERIGQAQAKVSPGYGAGKGQANADILATSTTYGQAQADIKVTTWGFAQAAASIVYRRYSGANALAEIDRQFTRSAAYSQAVTDDAPILWYRLRETSLSGPVNEMDPLNNGTYGSDTQIGFNGTLEPLGSSSSINITGGANENILINYYTYSPVTDTFTLEFWAKNIYDQTIDLPTETTSGDWSSVDDHFLWTMGFSDFSLGVSLGTNGLVVFLRGTDTFAPISVYTGDISYLWHYYVITVDANIAKIYVDSVLVHTGATSSGTIYPPILLGGSTDGTWSGLLGEPAVYNYVLPDDRIVAHYTANYLYGWANASVLITRSSWKSAQAQAKINAFKVKGYGQAQAWISVRHFSGGQAQTLIDSTRVYAASTVWILRTENGFGQANADIHAISYHFAQATLRVRRTEWGSAQAAAEIVYKRWSFGQARATIIRGVPPGTGGGPPPIFPDFGPAQYVVVYNNTQMAGYAQSESIQSVTQLDDFLSFLWDGSKTQNAGIINQEITMEFLIVERTWKRAKDAYFATVAAVTANKDKFNQLFIDYLDRYYLAMFKSISYEHVASSGVHLLRYTVTWEAMPYLYSSTETVLS